MQSVTANSKERGSILLYALLVITFLSGLAGYLQSMSDPVAFSATDSKDNLDRIYLKESIENIMPVLGYYTPTMSSNAGTQRSAKRIAATLNKYTGLRIYKKYGTSDGNLQLLGSSALTKYVSSSDFSYVNTDKTVTIPIHMKMKVPLQKKSFNQDIKIKIYFSR